MNMTLTVTKRDTTEKNEVIRKAGNVPAIVYGPKQTPVNLLVDGKEFKKLLDEAGESTIVELKGLEKPIEVLIKEVSFDPVKQVMRHVDFYAIERGKEITTHVPLEFIGESPAEQNGLGIVSKILHEIEVTCRPAAIPQHVEVDLAALVDTESKIHVSDLKLAKDVTIENEDTDVIALISVVKEEVDEVIAVDMDAIEVEEKGKTETKE